jgi:hypothetical protein
MPLRAATQFADAEARWKAYVAPEVARLEAAISAVRQDVERLVASQEREAARRGRLAGRGHSARRASERFAAGLAVYREALEGEEIQTRRRARRAVRPAPVHDEPTAGRDFGPDI